jgi:hypothetical protein
MGDAPIGAAEGFMGTRIPHPPFSTPSVDDLAARNARVEQPDRPERIARRGPRRVPVRRRARASPAVPALVVALLLGAIAVALIRRRSG